MASMMGKKWQFISSSPYVLGLLRSFRSDAALEALSKAAAAAYEEEDGTQNIVLYNYPSFSGSFSALFSHIFHSKLHLPCLILPFSSLHPFRVEDLCIQGLKKCYFLDFLGPKGFAAELAQRMSCEVIAFDHRTSSLSRIPTFKNCDGNLTVHVDLEKSSSTSVYEYLSIKLSEIQCNKGDNMSLLKTADQDRVEMVLKYIEDVDIRRWSLPDVEAFNIGLGQLRTKLNCITNPLMYEQLLEISAERLISNGNSYVSAQQNAAKKFLNKAFKVRLGRGFYGECLGVRIDEDPNLSDEIGKQLSVKSATCGLRPIGAVIYMKRNNLKMCLRTTDAFTDTSEIAKAYGGGGKKSSSSFIIRMDEYNQWLSAHSS